MNDAVYHQYARVLGEHWWTRARRRQVEDLLKRAAYQREESARVLEIGSGAGTEFDFLSQFGGVTGVEISPIGAQYCRDRGYQELHECDLNSFEPEPSSFDLIADFHVLYHSWIESPERVLRSLVSGLAPNGLFVFSEPAFEILQRSHDEAVMSGRRWRRGQLKKMLVGAGLKIERIVGFTYAATPVAFASAMLDRVRRPKPGHDEVDELQQPSRVVERIADTVMAVERGFNRVVSLPVATAWIGVARRPGSDET